jgi:UPF0271 protein
MTTQSIDLNADLGEGGAYDEALFPLISSANIACGVHAGDGDTMRRSVQLALHHGVAIGAHPSLNDREGFGRHWFQVDEPELRDQVWQQITALQRICGEEGAVLRYVKAHGALYNQAMFDESVATTITRAVSAVDSALHLFAQPGSALERIATQQGLPVVREAFADRAYNADGTLVRRDIAGAVLHDPDAIAARIIRLVTTGEIDTIDGQIMHLPADTICLHSDTPGAVDIATNLRRRLREAGIEIVAIS